MKRFVLSYRCTAGIAVARSHRALVAAMGGEPDEESIEHGRRILTWYERPSGGRPLIAAYDAGELHDVADLSYGWEEVPGLVLRGSPDGTASAQWWASSGKERSRTVPLGAVRESIVVDVVGLGRVTMRRRGDRWETTTTTTGEHGHRVHVVDARDVAELRDVSERAVTIRVDGVRVHPPRTGG